MPQIQTKPAICTRSGPDRAERDAVTMTTPGRNGLSIARATSASVTWGAGRQTEISAERLRGVRTGERTWRRRSSCGAADGSLCAYGRESWVETAAVDGRPRVQGAIGLKLEAGKRPIDTIVIDHVERPAPEN